MNFIRRNRASLALICAITAVLVIAGEIGIEGSFHTPIQAITAWLFLMIFIFFSFVGDMKSSIPKGKPLADPINGAHETESEHEHLAFLKTLIGHSYWLLNPGLDAQALPTTCRYQLIIFYNKGDLLGLPNPDSVLTENSIVFSNLRGHALRERIAVFSDSALGYLTSPVRPEYESVLAVDTTGQVTVLSELFLDMRMEAFDCKRIYEPDSECSCPSCTNDAEMKSDLNSISRLANEPDEIPPYDIEITGFSCDPDLMPDNTLIPIETMSKKKKIEQPEWMNENSNPQQGEWADGVDTNIEATVEYKDEPESEKIGDGDFNTAHTVATPNEVHRHDKQLYADIHSFARVPKSISDLERKLQTWGREFKTYTDGTRVYFDVASYNQPFRVRVPLTGAFDILA